MCKFKAINGIMGMFGARIARARPAGSRVPARRSIFSSATDKVLVEGVRKAHPLSAEMVKLLEESKREYTWRNGNPSATHSRFIADEFEPTVEIKPSSNASSYGTLTHNAHEGLHAASFELLSRASSTETAIQILESKTGRISDEVFANLGHRIIVGRPPEGAVKDTVEVLEEYKKQYDVTEAEYKKGVSNFLYSPRYKEHRALLDTHSVKETDEKGDPPVTVRLTSALAPRLKEDVETKSQDKVVAKD